MFCFPKWQCITVGRADFGLLILIQSSSKSIYIQFQWNKYKQDMPKTFIINIDHNYPFLLPQNNNLPPQALIKVRRSISVGDISKQLSSKILFVNNLKNKYLIKIQSIVQSSSTLQINYEYIKTPQINRDTQFWEAIMPQLHSFTQYLINIGVKTNISTHKIGVTPEGILKYYLGLEFEFDETQDERQLHQHYENQLNLIVSAYGIDSQQVQEAFEEEINQSAQIVRYQDRSMQKYRKASVATLPSHGYGTFRLSDELNRIKNSVREMARYHYGVQNRDLNNNKSQNQFHKMQYEKNEQKTKALSPSYFENTTKKQIARKYSADGKNIIESNRKLSAKFTDFRSDRKNSKQYTHKSVVKIQGGKLKSRMQQSKYQQYIEIASAKKDNKYIKDFMSVLEDHHNEPLTSQSQNIMIPVTYEAYNSASNIRLHNSKYLTNETQTLRLKVQQSIKNSLKIIKKVKGIC